MPLTVFDTRAVASDVSTGFRCVIATMASASNAASKNSMSSSAHFFPESLLCLHFGTEPHPDSSEAYAARAFPYSPSAMTSFLNALPRSMKFANWSNAAHAGESVTMSPRTARS